MNKRKLSLKWFGSLTNLSTRRQKAIVKAAPEHDGKLSGAAAEAQSVDDMESYSHSSSYACSRHMYTHVGTVPRSEKLKKSFKEKKKKEEEGESGGQSQWEAGDHVRESPLLAALSGLSLSSLDRPANAATPAGASPLTPASKGHRHADASAAQGSGKPPHMATNGPTGGSAQDVYVPMDRGLQAARGHVEERRGGPDTQESSGTAVAAQEVTTGDGRQSVTDSTGEYVKFSREKFRLEPPSEKLRKQLEEELELSGTNLKSHAWYHGCIPWEVSESLVLNHGEFLIRDSQSSQGDFVLTSRWEHKTRHFLIKKTAIHNRLQYSLEGETFESLPALVHFYVGSQAVLTWWSGAQIHRPVNRTLPLSYLETAFHSAVSSKASLQNVEGGSMSGEQWVCPGSPSSLQHQEADGDRTPVTGTLHSNAPQSTSATPSPSRAQNSGLQTPCCSDAEGSCYTELFPSPQSYVDRLQGFSPLRVEDGNMFFSPVVETASSFTPSRYRSPLMPKENKPLEVGVLRRVKELLAEIDPRTAAKHMTKADCTVARILEVTAETQRRMGVSSGMELLTLPHGQQLRLDLLERFHTMATTLAVHVLGCTGTSEERAGLLHKLIQTAAELKSTMGNMYGFTAVMRALELPQVARLEQTWMALRQRHTEGAILYEKTLRPFMKSLNEGRESCPLSNTSFPHVLPLLSLLERSPAGEGTEPWETLDVGVDVVLFHLGAARTIAQLGGIYRSNTEHKLQDFQDQAEVLDIFSTDFQMRLLWGSRGAEEKQALRYAKFDQVLTALSNKLEPPVRRR
ncbi:SH2 domain containing 3Cb isoform X2 [Betta splendens]|uniref:SH2 domain containing 3Cb isoform X2 n=1 Tax=Betta splendens TaxID=158456 RepID=A0A6P7NC74_BETSP|nr:SH2 domain containing 3Cb isoform X2 [Betta splendens]